MRSVIPQAEISFVFISAFKETSSTRGKEDGGNVVPEACLKAVG